MKARYQKLSGYLVDMQNAWQPSSVTALRVPYMPRTLENTVSKLIRHLTQPGSLAVLTLGHWWTL